MIVVTRSEKEETQEGKIKGEISIPTHPWSHQKEKLHFNSPLIALHVSIVAHILS
jgi:hypothetical protein